MKSPIAGSFDTNQNSLDWSIQSPDGRVHHVRNLRLWLKKHKNNLPGTVTQAFAGFMQMKRCILGNTKRNVFQWKGYRLIAFE